MELERIDDVALIRLRGGKANAMTRDMLVRLEQLVGEAQASGAGAVAITGYDRFFSAGLAMPALIDLPRAEMREFIDLFGRVMLGIFMAPIPIVAAVNGHAIAGGCVLALQCDVRLMSDADLKIGLNEVQLGIGLPSSVIEPLRLQVPAASLAPIALEGRLFTPAEAQRLGLVDEVVPAERLLDAALARARALAQLPRGPLAQVKLALRRGALEAAQRHGGEERERWLDCWFAPDGQTRLRAAIARLK
jgi:enoyl-CoA hydratase